MIAPLTRASPAAAIKTLAVDLPRCGFRWKAGRVLLCLIDVDIMDGVPLWVAMRLFMTSYHCTRHCNLWASISLIGVLRIQIGSGALSGFG